MDQASAQTEKIATYETSRTRRSIVDGNIHSDDSNNDEEYATSGFYVREKTTEKKPEPANNKKESEKVSEEEYKENGIPQQTSSPPSPLVNGENSEDGETSRDSMKNNTTEETQKEEESNSKENVSSENDNTRDSAKEKGDIEGENEDEGKKEESEDVNDKKGSEDQNDKKGSEDEIDKKGSEDENDKKGSEDENGKKGSEDENDKKGSEDENDKKGGEDENNKGKSEDIDSKIAEKNSEECEKIEENVVEKESDAVEKEVKKVEDEKNEEKNEPKEETLKKEDVCENNKETNKDKEEEKDEKQESSTSAVEMADEKPDEKNDNYDAEATETDKSKGSILKEQLEKEKTEETSDGNGAIENVDHEVDMDEDFDPSLLCPDISMDVDEAPVITNNESVPEDGNTSPLPYEATFSTLVDEITGAEVQVDLTPEEMELRSKMYGPNNLVQKTKIHCTACNIHLGSALTGANNRFVHPLLKVLICKNCYHFYTSGEFEKDEDGSELYCRWCGQGGQVLCCSSCEFVFCKRCIRNNFGPKKFKEIRDSDDWNCFRCDRPQLSNLRASCAEFMEYYRTELARAQALAQTNPELMTTDYTTCCKSGQEKKEETKTPAPQKSSARRKRKDEEDPDYSPVVEEVDEPPKKKLTTSDPSGGPGYTIIPPSNLRAVPKPNGGQIIRPIVVTQGQKSQNQGQVFKVGTTTFRPRTPTNGPGYTVQRPTAPPGQKSNSPGYITIPPSAAPKNNSPGYITIPPSAAPKTTSPGYIKILPQRMQGPRASNSYTIVSGSGANSGKPTFTTVRPKTSAPMPSMKHEWFEKTVRAAARVNSNLSYTLTQLNRQQSQASSVEALAMVHNKLQEVLSTSINSLIQIRKNLRTEFIAGIKNIKFPPKPAPVPSTSGPIVVKDDDDVIYVSPSKTPASNQLPPPPPLVISPAVTLTKKTPIQKNSDPLADPMPSTSSVTNKAGPSTTSSSSAPVKGGFLKVRSFTALQTVPSECITIPDDPVGSHEKAAEVEEDPLKLTDDDKPNDEPKVFDSPTLNTNHPILDEFFTYNTKEEPSQAVRKMMNATVMVKRSRVVDEIIRAQGLLSGPQEKNIDGDKKEQDVEVNEEKEESINKEESVNKEENDKEASAGVEEML